MTELDAMRGVCRELGGPWVDLWSAAAAAQALFEHRRTHGLRGATARDAARDVVSATLVDAANAGDTGARDRLVALWRADVLHWSRWQAPRGAVPDDIAQDAVLRICALLPRLRRADRFRAWAWGIVMNVAREHGRRSVWRRWVPWVGADVADPNSGPERIRAPSERARQVQDVLYELTDDDRALLWLHYVEGLGRAELAERTGLPRGTLNRRMTEARRAFERAAARMGLEPGEEP